MTGKRIDKLVDDVIAASSFGPQAVDPALGELLSSIDEELPSDKTHKLLDQLRSDRHFDQLQRASDTFVDLGSVDPYVHRQLCQALIEKGAFGLAERTLNYTINDLRPEGRELSEALGLMGRLYKQKFVQATPQSKRSVQLINEAVKKYAEAYPLDPAWHGSNLVALTARAERDKIPLQATESSQEYAARLLADLDKTKGNWGPWDFAAATEASLGIGDFDAAADYLGKYVNFPPTKNVAVDGFMLASTARQLSEVWEINPDDDSPQGKLMSSLVAASLTNDQGGQFDFRAGEIQALEEGIDNARDDGTLEAIFGDDATLKHSTITGLIKHSGAVCQVIHRSNYEFQKLGTGTGFVVKGSAIHDSLGDSLYLLTNHHVLSDDGEHPSVELAEADVIFHSWEGPEPDRRFQVDSIIAWSDRTQLDLTLATLKDFPATLPAAITRFNTSTSSLHIDKSRVHLIGHPGGRDLSYSVSNNLVKDHDLTNTQARANRIHYANPTEKGMSGSPVLQADNLQVVGVHRRGGRIKPIHDAKRPPTGSYERTRQSGRGQWHARGLPARFRNQGGGNIPATAMNKTPVSSPPNIHTRPMTMPRQMEIWSERMRNSRAKNAPAMAEPTMKPNTMIATMTINMIRPMMNASMIAAKNASTGFMSPKSVGVDGPSDIIWKPIKPDTTADPIRNNDQRMPIRTSLRPTSGGDR